MLIIAGGIIAAVWAKPDEAGLGQRAFFTILTINSTVLLLNLWLLLLSGTRWYVRVGVLVLEIAAAAVFLPGVAFQGDMVPVIRWPWERDRVAVLEEHRRLQAAEASAIVPDLTIGPFDSPEYRGVKRDGVMVGPNLNRDWKAKAPKLLWKQPCGGGYASFAVAGNVAVTIEQRRDKEVVAAYHIDNGKELWKYEYSADFQEPMGGPGPRATPTIADGNVYSLGATGHLACLDGKTGHPKWTAEILAGNKNLHWAMSGSPLVVGKLVIVSPGCQNEDNPSEIGLLAFDRNSGDKVWSGGNAKGGYSSPMLATFADRKQIVVFEGRQIAGYDLADGKLLWSYPWMTLQDINVAQPIVDEKAGTVFISSGYNVGCALLKIQPGDNNTWKVDVVWKKENKPLRCKFCSPVEYEGDYYGLDEGFLACIDAKTGERHWRETSAPEGRKHR